MSLTLRTDFGCTEAIIDDDCGLKRFYEVANILSDDLEIKFQNKEDDFDTLTWDFHFKGSTLTLHYNIYTKNITRNPLLNQLQLPQPA